MSVHPSFHRSNLERLPPDLTTPGAVMARLAEIEQDLAIRQNAYESAAMRWYREKRNREKARAVSFLGASGSVAERSAIADRDTATDGVEAEAEFEALKAVMRTLEARASIGQSLLRAQSHV